MSVLPLGTAGGEGARPAGAEREACLTPRALLLVPGVPQLGSTARGMTSRRGGGGDTSVQMGDDVFEAPDEEDKYAPKSVNPWFARLTE